VRGERALALLAVRHGLVDDDVGAVAEQLA
jgi:hypothetical protein